MKPSECCILIPSLSPDGKLTAYVRTLLDADFGGVVVVDDGSPADSQAVFDEVGRMDGCIVLRHPVNRGKGAALRTGTEYIRDHTAFNGVITADSDGQHTAEDTLALADRLTQDAREMILGARDFSLKNKSIPFKSRAGNRLTSCVFLLLYGHFLPDTQTGLRAYNRGMYDFMLEISGDRYEYETNALVVCAGRHVPVVNLPIATIYIDDNKGSHFHPVRDSWRIYKILFGNFFRYASASVLSTLLDLGLFSVLSWWVLPLFIDSAHTVRLLNADLTVLIATAAARVCSAIFNYTVNKRFVFSLSSCRGAALRYFTLCAWVMLVSGFAVAAFKTALPSVNETVVKIIVDTVLFVVNYRLQKGWVFAGQAVGTKGA